MFINTTRAFYITLAVLSAGFVWSTFYPEAPYASLVAGIGAMFGITVAKRYAQKKLNGKEHDSYTD